MACWSGAHGDWFTTYPCGWYAPLSSSFQSDGVQQALPPSRPPLVETPSCSAKTTYAMAAMPPAFRVGDQDHSLKPPSRLTLPVGLLNDLPPSPPMTPSPPKVEKTLSFDDTTLNEFFEWVEGRRECLSPLASTDLGFDQWTYELRHKPLPTPAQENALKRRIWELANDSPLKLWNAIQLCQLNALLGEGFAWVQTPRKW